MFTLFAHGPAAGSARKHNTFETVEAAEGFLESDPLFEEGASLYLVSGDRIWALTDESIEDDAFKFYEATSESWAPEQIQLMKN